MSRHTLPLPKGGLLIVGYDRPLDHFFVQEWKAKHNGAPTISEDNVDLDEVKDHYKRKLGVIFPNSLRAQLAKEAVAGVPCNESKKFYWS